MTASRIATALVTVFVVTVVALWVRHRAADEREKERLAGVVAAARADDEARILAIREAMAKDAPSTRPCPLASRVTVVRLDRVDAPGGRLRDVLAALAERRPPPARSPIELDVVEGRAFLYDYDAKRIVCIGKDAEDPHGTLTAVF